MTRAQELAALKVAVKDLRATLKRIETRLYVIERQK